MDGLATQVYPATVFDETTLAMHGRQLLEVRRSQEIKEDEGDVDMQQEPWSQSRP